MRNVIGRRLRSFAGALGGLAFLVSGSCGNNPGGNGGGNIGNIGGGNRYNIDAGRYSGEISCSSSLGDETDYLSIEISNSGIPYVSPGNVYSVGDTEHLFIEGISGNSIVTYVGNFSLLPGALQINEDAVFSSGNERINANITYLLVSCGQNLPEPCNDSESIYFGGNYEFETGDSFSCEGELYRQ